jgi:hypothetical protein
MNSDSIRRDLLASFVYIHSENESAKENGVAFNQKAKAKTDLMMSVLATIDVNSSKLNLPSLRPYFIPVSNRVVIASNAGFKLTRPCRLP